MKLTKANIKKLSSKSWRMHNLYKIIDKDAKAIVFKPKPEQDSFMKNRAFRNLILKARQLGFTTLARIDFLDDALWNKNFTCVIIAHEEKAMESIFRGVRFTWEKFYEEFGQHLGFKADTSRANMLSFNNGSVIKVALSSRGEAVQRLHVSEFGKICAKYPNKAEEIVTGAFPSVPPNGRITIESTAEGETGYFHDYFWDAWDRGEPQSKKQFKAFFFPWYLDGGYVESDNNIIVPQRFLDYQKQHNLTDDQIRWYYITWQDQKDLMKREYPTTPEEAFESSGVKVFNVDALNYQIKNHVTEGDKVGGWTFYEEYNPRHQYVIGADPSEGIGRDSSAAVVIDISWRENGRLIPKVVAVFCSNQVPPDIFAYELRRGGNIYGNCLIGVERNGNGLATLTQLKQIYSNLYTEMRKSSFEDKQTERLGFLTTAGSKSTIIFNLATTLNENDIIIPDGKTLRELRAYDEVHLKTIRYKDDVSKHLDRVMALAISWEMKNYLSPAPFNSGHQSEEHAYVTGVEDFDPYSTVEI